jgi:hypothetical protein
VETFQESYDIASNYHWYSRHYWIEYSRTFCTHYVMFPTLVDGGILVDSLKISIFIKMKGLFKKCPRPLTRIKEISERHQNQSRECKNHEARIISQITHKNRDRNYQHTDYHANRSNGFTNYSHHIPNSELGMIVFPTSQRVPTITPVYTWAPWLQPTLHLWIIFSIWSILRQVIL